MLDFDHYALTCDKQDYQVISSNQNNIWTNFRRYPGCMPPDIARVCLACFTHYASKANTLSTPTLNSAAIKMFFESLILKPKPATLLDIFLGQCP